MDKSENHCFDLTFIGAGLSCTYTLIHFLKGLEGAPPKNKTRICIIDKANEFWTGSPYGNRSGANSLIITSLKDFLPETERSIFITWFKENLKELTEKHLLMGRFLAISWLKNNERLISTKMWDKLYIPRYIFGEFLKTRINQLLKSAEKKGYIEYSLLMADVINAERQNNIFKVIANDASGNKLHIQSQKVILSVGSPPKQELKILKEPSVKYICIQDIYDPFLKENIDKIYTHLENVNSPLKKNILILGSNASSLEVIYNLQNSKESERLINKYYILSPNGMFPNRINEGELPATFVPVNMASLINSTSNTCNDILEAVKKDFELARNKQIAIADIFEPVWHTIIKLLDTLDINEQKQFVYTYGREISKLQTRSGAEYLNIPERLIAENRLEFIRGKFINQLPAKDEHFQFEYADCCTGHNITFPYPVTAVVNCTGSENIDESLSPLIQNLIKQKLCLVNGSRIGFIVNENFESSKNFFVIGPLLSGTLNSKIRIWNAESCPRIFFLSQQLADHLIKSEESA